MATYKEIKGVTVQTLETRIQVENVGSWSSGGPIGILLEAFLAGWYHKLVQLWSRADLTPTP